MAPTNPLQIVRGLTRHLPNDTAVANLRALGVQKRPLLSLTDATDELISYKVRIGACACQNMVLRVLVPCMGFRCLCSAPRQASYYAQRCTSDARAINNPLRSGHSIRCGLVSANRAVTMAAPVATITVVPAAEPTYTQILT